MKIPHKTLERRLFGQGYDHIIGVDEVGMGCLAGPVVVCAALFGPAFYRKRHKKLEWLRDSKLLLSHQREKYAVRLMEELLKDSSFRYHIAVAPVELIDQVNVYQAARRAMADAIKKLKVKSEKLKIMVLVDGNKKIHGLEHEQTAIVKGDRKIFAIACASVIAKVFRDKMMARLAKKHTGYGMEIHKGYATKIHRERIKVLGLSPIHRRSFRVR